MIQIKFVFRLRKVFFYKKSQSIYRFGFYKYLYFSKQHTVINNTKKSFF